MYVDFVKTKIFVRAFIACGFLFAGNCEEITVNKFSSVIYPAGEIGDNQTYSDTRRSKLECAVSCRNHPNCLSFTFDKETKLCYRSAQLVRDAGYKIYKSADGGTASTTTTLPTTTVDPEDLCIPGGYTYYTAENICMKVYTERVFQVDNKVKCAADGGHLLLIKDAAMHNFIRAELIKLGSDDVFIDGEDPELDGSFVTWEGNPLPYWVWKSGDPDMEPCLRLSSSANFDFGDELCTNTYKHGCVCQKEIQL